jgi:hypothetical protein
MRRIGLSVAFMTVVGIAAAPARATVMVELAVEDMAAAADAIVIGRVVRSDVQLLAEPNAQGLRPWTVTRLEVEQWLEGPGGARVEILERGGVWQGGGQVIAGTPTYRAGDRVLVFLRIDVYGRWRTYGMAQGKWDVHAGVPGTPTTAQRDLSDLGLVHWAGGQMIVNGGTREAPVPLRDLIERIIRVREALR